jgi:hypothetical protein
MYSARLTFTSTSIAGKKMIVQATNTGADLGEGQFDLAIPGGGVGICKHFSLPPIFPIPDICFPVNGCTDEWGAPSSGWGQQYGGISDGSACAEFPSALQPGCKFRFGDWFEGADNPTVDYKQVTCPSELTAITGCKRDDDGGDSSSGSPAPSEAAPSSVAAPASSSVPVESSAAVSSAPVSSAAPPPPPAPSSEAPVPVSSSSSAVLGSTYLPGSSAAPSPPEESCEIEYVYA